VNALKKKKKFTGEETDTECLPEVTQKVIWGWEGESGSESKPQNFTKGLWIVKMHVKTHFTHYSINHFTHW
jgi:hypothetical protein